MSNMSSFKREVSFGGSSSDLPVSLDHTNRFNLTEKVDPKKSGIKNFQYDSEKARDFEETNVKKSREGAKEILRDAINKTKAKSIQIREEARNLGYEEGFKEGFEKGELDAKQEYRPFLKTVQDLISDLSRFRN